MPSRRGPRATALLLVLATLAMGASATTRQAGAASPGAYFALGDSIAAGVGTSLPRTRSYPALVRGWLEAQTAATVPFANLAVPGETTDSFLTGGQFERFTQDVARERQAGRAVMAVSVTLGGNELLDVQQAATNDRQAALDAFAQSFPRALQLVREQVPDARLVVTTYYDPTEGDGTLQFSDAWWITQFNAVIVSAAQAQSAAVADVNAGFRYKIASFTRYPLDVHPTNDGSLDIARLVWGALRIDSAPPEITVTSPGSATRRTPTLRFIAADPAGLQAVTVTAEGGAASTPTSDGADEDEYVALLDFTAIDGTTATVTIEAIDQAGNVAKQVVQMTVPDNFTPPPAASPTTAGQP